MDLLRRKQFRKMTDERFPARRSAGLQWGPSRRGKLGVSLGLLRLPTSTFDRSEDQNRTLEKEDVQLSLQCIDLIPDADWPG